MSKAKPKQPTYFHLKFWNDEKQVFEIGDLRFKDFGDMALAAIGWKPVGDTDKALKSLVTLLRWVKDHQDLATVKSEYIKHATTRETVFGLWDELLFQFMHEKDLAEGTHSLPGVLTDTGRDILKALESYFQQIEDLTLKN